MKSARFNYAFLFLWLLVGSGSGLLAQDAAYARRHLDTLSSAAFHGRGYVGGGQQLAAEYLLREFSRLGLQPLSDNYLQPFSLEVNTFDSIYLRLNKQLLVPGSDFVVHPMSGHGEAKKLKPGKGLVLAEDGKQPKEMGKNPRLILESTDQKFTWSVGRDQWPLAYVEVRKKALPAKIKRADFYFSGSYKPHTVANVAGLVRGKKQPDSIIVICAHYDHLGRMGSVLFPGANDNASGTALLLDLARHYSQPQHQPDFSLLFIGFAAEEAGLVGSNYFVNNPLVPLNRISLVLNLDLMAGGSEGIMVVNGEAQSRAYQLLDSINRQENHLKSVQKRANAANSDHYPFTQKGVPAIFVYTLGDVTAYHDPNDRAESLRWQHYRQIFGLLRSFTDQWQQP